MRKISVLLFVFFFICINSAYAQWDGNLKVDGGWNFLKSNTENADFKLKYTGEKFYLGTDLYAGHSFLPSSQITSTIDTKQEMSEYYKGEDKTLHKQNLRKEILSV